MRAQPLNNSITSPALLGQVHTENAGSICLLVHHVCVSPSGPMPKSTRVPPKRNRRFGAGGGRGGGAKCGEGEGYNHQFKMKSRLSMEVKKMLEEKKSARSRCKLETSTTLTSCSTQLNSSLKRSESSSTLPRTHSQISTIQDRFLTLETDYRHLLEETRRKGELFRQQRQDLDWYKSAHQRSQKELERLRALIGFVKRADFSTQTEQPLPETTKRDKAAGSLPKERRSPLNLGRNTATAKEWAAYCKGGSGLKKVRSGAEEGRGGMSRFKFVPSLALA